MELVEVRDLDGPNVFALHPVLKLEVWLTPDERVSEAAQASVREQLGIAIPAAPLDALKTIIVHLHERVGLPAPATGTRSLDRPGHVAIFYDWTWRETALEIGRLAVQLTTGQHDTDPTSQLAELLEQDLQRDDRPLWIRDDRRLIPSVGITGTNGKTTTTRMLAHLVRATGKRVGWTSTSGVYIDGEQVIEGDYTGPAGARRVLEDPTVEVAVLETARGGILLRGMACESNDVSVFLNVSADHLEMQGVQTVETLAEVKSVVIRITKPDGLVVLNADDPLVLAQRDRVQAPVLLTSQGRAPTAVEEHVAAGGQALVSDGTTVWRIVEGQRKRLVELVDVPATYNGAATHMVENALAAIGAAIGLGLSETQIVEGLGTFRSDVRSNAGRLNVFRLQDRIVVVDYAHNEHGLEMLLNFARRMVGPSGRLSAIVGTAGDRHDSQLQRLGQVGAELADRLYLKETGRYLRGRSPGEVTALMLGGANASANPERLVGEFESEYVAFQAALDDTQPGDVIAMMCLEEQLTVLRELRDRGAEEW